MNPKEDAIATLGLVAFLCIIVLMLTSPDSNEPNLNISGPIVSSSLTVG